MPTIIGNKQLKDFPAKTSPVPADILYLGDSEDSFLEKKSTIAQTISAYPALSSIAGLTTAANKMIYTTASNTYAVTDLTSFARSLLDDSNATLARTTLGAAESGANSSITSLIECTLIADLLTLQLDNLADIRVNANSVATMSGYNGTVYLPFVRITSAETPTYELVGWDTNDSTIRAFLTITPGSTPHMSIGTPAGGLITLDGTSTNPIPATYMSLNNTDGTLQNARFYTPIVSITSATTLGNSHFGKKILFNSPINMTVTFPQQSTLTTEAGNWSEFQNIGAGTVTFVKEGSETLSGNILCAPGGSGKIFRNTTTNWSISGGTALEPFQDTYTIDAAADETYPGIKMQFSGILMAIATKCSSGTCTLTSNIGGITVTATPNAVSSTDNEQAVTNGGFTSGSYIGSTVSLNSSCVRISVTLIGTYYRNVTTYGP